MKAIRLIYLLAIIDLVCSSQNPNYNTNNNNYPPNYQNQHFPAYDAQGEYNQANQANRNSAYPPRPPSNAPGYNFNQMKDIVPYGSGTTKQ
jgi:hypothetical protein